MNINPDYLNQLPVGAIAASVNDALRRSHRLVVTAPPGSGKSTLLPLTILESLPEGRIVMLEPRRAAARQIAVRMAQMLGEKAGETVGYRMRFESRISARTRIEVVTDGVMERMLIDDPTLEDIAVVIFDEFHERSLTADLILAMTLEAQNVLRPDLNIVIMSATIETAELCAHLKAPLIEAAGRMFDVRIVNCEDADAADCVPAVVSAVKRALREQTGNILAFLPGQAEIERCSVALSDSGAVILPLYGMLSPAEQQRALDWNPDGGRKIVLATPIAETSLTIRGVRTVVDSGFYRAVRFNPSTGLSRLETDRISMDMARQRTGRAGRLEDGICYRLWSKATEFRMKENRIPEILSADLSGMVLDIAAWGGADAESLPWITPPPAGHLAEAKRILQLLGAVDEKSSITGRGRRMAALPCHPRIANMLISAQDGKTAPLAADIAALLEEKDPLNDVNYSDINTRIAMLRGERCRKGNGGKFRKIIRIAEQYRKMVRCAEDNSDVDSDLTGALIASAYPERIAMHSGNDSYALAGGENVRLDNNDSLAGHQFLAVASMSRRIFLASPVSGQVLEGMAESRSSIVWNSKEGRVNARSVRGIGALILSSRPLDNPDRDEIISVICRAAVKDGLSMFDFNDDVERLQRRIAQVAEWHPELELPDVGTPKLLSTAEQWLPMYIGKATTASELRKIDMCQVIEGILGYELQTTVDRLAPSHIRLPGGRNVRIDYRSGAELPVVSARLQNCFGLIESPRIDDGRCPVLMELLSPGFKPVQLTQDMKGFWSNTYFEVRKELRRRYPKHRWPDDPLAIMPDADNSRTPKK